MDEDGQVADILEQLIQKYNFNGPVNLNIVQHNEVEVPHDKLEKDIDITFNVVL